MSKSVSIVIFLLLIIGLCISGASIAQAQRAALFVVDTGAPDTSGDDAISARLVDLGYTVTAVDDNVCQTSDANGKDLVVCSSTVAFSNPFSIGFSIVIDAGFTLM